MSMERRGKLLDAAQIRKDFPILSKKVNGHPLVYFDSAATSQKPRQVIDGIRYFYENLNANPLRSIHKLAEEATIAYNAARDKVAKFINADPDEIVFVRNTTEAINLASYALPLKKGDRVVSSYLEHHSNILPWLRLKDIGVTVDFVDVDDEYELDMEHYRSLPNDTRLVTVSHESNVSGTVNDVREIAALAHEAGAMVLIDAAQSAPHMKIDVKDIGADLLAFSGHKMLGPFGIGVLYVNKTLHEHMKPFLTGGEMIESVRLNDVRYQKIPRFYEAGTQDVEGAYGLGLAIDYLNRIGMGNVEAYDKALTEHLFDSVRSVKGLDVYGGKSGKYGPILSFNVKGLHSHDVAYFLDKKGFALRSGFHCAQPFIEDKLKANGTARASLYIYNTLAEIDRFAAEIKNIARKYGRI